jgi:hypothetical protein
VNGTLRSDVENKRIRYSRIHSAGGSNTFDRRLCVNGALRSDVEIKESRTAEYIRLADRICSTRGSVCEWRSKIGCRNKRITYSRIHSAGGPNMFDTRVGV